MNNTDTKLSEEMRGNGMYGGLFLHFTAVKYPGSRMNNPVNLALANSCMVNNFYEDRVTRGAQGTITVDLRSNSVAMAIHPHFVIISCFSFVLFVHFRLNERCPKTLRNGLQQATREFFEKRLLQVIPKFAKSVIRVALREGHRCSCGLIPDTIGTKR